jgi:cytochrome c peroxidase
MIDNHMISMCNLSQRAAITKGVGIIRIAVSSFVISIVLFDFNSFAVESEYALSASEIVPLGLPAPPVSESNDPMLVGYGQFLFQSPFLSRDQSISCASCHHLSRALSGPEPVAIGIGGAVGRRHPPSLFNLYAARALMWDGRATSLAEQIQLPLQSASEMDIDWPSARRRLSDHKESRVLLSADQVIDRTLVLSALAAYVRSLVTGGSAFDRYYFQGDGGALSAQAQEGLIVFVRRGRCATCHTVTGYSALLTDNGFHSVGVGFAGGRYKDEGRFEVTRRASDRGLFKTPSLRNVTQRRYFMHDGSMTSLREVVDYYDRGGNKPAPNLDERIRPLFLSDREKEALIAFLASLESPIVSYRPGSD